MALANSLPELDPRYSALDQLSLRGTVAHAMTLEQQKALLADLLVVRARLAKQAKIYSYPTPCTAQAGLTTWLAHGQAAYSLFRAGVLSQGYSLDRELREELHKKAVPNNSAINNALAHNISERRIFQFSRPQNKPQGKSEVVLIGMWQLPTDATQPASLVICQRAEHWKRPLSPALAPQPANQLALRGKLSNFASLSNFANDPSNPRSGLGTSTTNRAAKRPLLLYGYPFTAQRQQRLDWQKISLGVLDNQGFFNLPLPRVMPASVLRPLSYALAGESALLPECQPRGLVVSDSAARTFATNKITVLQAGTTQVASPSEWLLYKEAYLLNDAASGAALARNILLYSDRPLTAKGQLICAADLEVTVDIKVKAGWSYLLQEEYTQQSQRYNTLRNAYSVSLSGWVWR